jgi:two-component system, OmpR family, response regulator MprA
LAQTSHSLDPTRSPIVLVVDDDHAIQEVMGMALEMEGYQVLLAGDGYEAIEKLKAEAPAIILFDMFLPRMDGLEFAAELSRLGLRPAIPIVVVSGDDRGRQKAIQIGAEGYLLKPFTIDDLLAQVSRLLQDRAESRGQMDG